MTDVEDGQAVEADDIPEHNRHSSQRDLHHLNREMRRYEEEHRPRHEERVANQERRPEEPLDELAEPRPTLDVLFVVRHREEHEQHTVGADANEEGHGEEERSNVRSSHEHQGKYVILICPVTRFDRPIDAVALGPPRLDGEVPLVRSNKLIVFMCTCQCIGMATAHTMIDRVSARRDLRICEHWVVGNNKRRRTAFVMATSHPYQRVTACR